MTYVTVGLQIWTSVNGAVRDKSAEVVPAAEAAVGAGDAGNMDNVDASG